MYFLLVNLFYSYCSCIDTQKREPLHWFFRAWTPITLQYMQKAHAINVSVSHYSQKCYFKVSKFERILK